jgi:hypothetical protein
MKNWLREPLLHFLLLGAALFALYRWVGGEGTAPERIVVSAATIERLADTWQRTWQRPPTRPELDGLIEDHVREEVLYREAMAAGLDRDDTIIRRRLRQKMEFVSEDIAAQDEPDEAELRRYLEQHPDSFRPPAHVSFTHVYLSPERRADRLRRDAARILERLSAAPADASHAGLGDAFALASGYQDIAVDELDRLFGDGFSTELAALPKGKWAGPIESGYGLHLVRVTEYRPGELPELAEIRAQVLREWSIEWRQKNSDEFYRKLRAQYSVIIEPAPLVGVMQAAGGAK